MHGVGWAIAFALCAALCMALGAGFRQRASATPEVVDSGSTRPTLAAGLWWLGVAVGLGGFVFQALALSAGPLLLVQPLLVASLLFLLPLGWILNGVRPSRSQWLWSGILTVSVALLLIVGNPAPGHHRVSLDTWGVVACVCFAFGAVAAVAARRFPGNVRAMILGAVSGGLFGGVAMLTKLVTVHVHHGGLVRVLLSWESLAIVIIAGLAIALQQLSYRAGSLHASFPAALVAEQIVAAGLGIMVLGEQLTGGVVARAALIALALVVCVSAVRLAVSQEPAYLDVTVRTG